MDTDTSSFMWTSASRTHPGRVRQINEDACLEQSDHGLWAVADGMGGHSLGDLASGLAVQSLLDLPLTETLEQRVMKVEQRVGRPDLEHVRDQPMDPRRQRLVKAWSRVSGC